MNLKDAIKETFITEDKPINGLSLKDIVKGTYTIKNNMVDVNGSVSIGQKQLTEIPWKFGEVSGYFDCGWNHIVSLKNAPHTVGKNFICNENHLVSLEFAPIYVGEFFYCGGNELTSLKYLPKTIRGNIYCDRNPIKSFKGVPFDMLSKIDDLEKSFSHLIFLQPVPIEFKSAVNILNNTFNPKKKPIKANQHKKRLNSI